MVHPIRHVAEFTDKYPLVGPLVWILCVQYFAGQLVAAADWVQPTYSWAQNAISDLGNTVCGSYAGRMVCSPSHALMNLSFILLGLTMAIGSGLIYHEFRKSADSRLGFSLMGLAGSGSILVGLFPENTVHMLHATGAVLALGVGNVSLIVLARALTAVRPAFRIFTFVCGAVALLAFMMFVGGVYLGLGLGGMERVASYPQTIWLTLFGLYMTATRVRARGSTALVKTR